MLFRSGINGTRLFTTLYHKKLVVGRVQTPTLAMLVERDGKISTFQKEKYFNVHVGKGDLIADLEKVKTEEEAKRIAAACEKKQAVVSSLKREMKNINPPKLYDLTTLQREANRYYGFTAQQTLDLVQTLYEKKLLTYPRTDSQFITDDMEDTARQVISIVCRQLPLFSGVSVTPDIARVTDNSKVTDHHAILPTVQLEKQEVSALPQSEQKILILVGMRLLCATGEKHTYAGPQNTAPAAPKKPRKNAGKAVKSIVALVLAAAMGFMGGFVGARFGGNNKVIIQKVERSDSSSADSESAAEGTTVSSGMTTAQVEIGRASCRERV